jgi:hypothetical protein
MPFITFIYKIGKRNYYGKYVSDYISDDHEGLDTEIRPLLLDGINRFRHQKGLSRLRSVKIGILSFSVDSYIPCFSSDKDYECFDFYLDGEYYGDHKLYVNGKQII